MADRNQMGSQLLAESLARDPRFEVVAVAAAAEVSSMIAARQPHLALISADLESGEKKGLQIARSLRSRHPSIQVVMLLGAGTRESVIAAFRCGATGVFCRTDSLSELFTCIERVSRGEIWASPSHCQFLLEAVRSTPSCEGIEAGKINLLSGRELQVAECAAQGQSNKQIADQLALSEHTIKNYLFRIFDKLGVSNRFELLFLVFRECNSQRPSGAGLSFGTEVGHPIETYLKSAEEGLVAAQFIVGLAHLEGYCVEKNESSAYFWLRMAAENSSELQQQSTRLVEGLRASIKQVDVDRLEHRVRDAMRDNRGAVAKRPQDIIQRSPSASLHLAV